MNDQEANIAVAEACGWNEIRMTNLHAAIGGPRLMGCKHPGDLQNIPDYGSSLDAMHEAEKAVIYPDKALTYSGHLLKIEDDTIDAWDAAFAMHATAAQRREAFLRTLGKWRDG